MLALQYATVLTPVFVTWMRTDEATTAQHQFSPKYPTEPGWRTERPSIG
jgi:hypothetical protein